MNIRHIIGGIRLFYNNYLQADLKPEWDVKQSTWVGIGVGVVSIGAGYLQKNKARKDAKSAAAQRVPYKTPKEMIEVVNALKGNAQDGLDPNTLNYLTNQNDRSFSNTAGLAERLGADPNQLSALFDQKIQNSMKIGSANHALNMENFSKYLSGEQLLAQGADAEWASREGMTKDKQQAAQMDLNAANQQIQSGLNSTISGLANYGTSKLYTDGGLGYKKNKFGADFNSIPGASELTAVK